MRRRDRHTRGPVRLAAALPVALLAVSGCGQRPALRPHQTDAEYNAGLAANFSKGMTREEVEAKLNGLVADTKFRQWYANEGASGGQLLQRVFEKGGLWIDGGDQTIKWIDTWFVFETGAAAGGRDGIGTSLERWYTQRGSQRYFEFEPIYGPPESETLGPTRRYPFPPPLPARPPEGSR